MEYIKSLHYAIAHLRRADAALNPKAEGSSDCSMDLLSDKAKSRCFFSAQLIRQNSDSLVLHRYTLDADDPIYGFWFFETYYQAFAKQLCCYSSKFNPTNAAEVEELLAYTVEM